MVGQMISHYRILSQLGAGGMGVVYLAEDVRLGREVAVKFVSDDFADDQVVLERLRFEARAASALNHPNICTIYDVGEFDSRPFIVMELMKGQTLRDRLLTGGPLRTHHLVDIGIAIADALQSTHTDGIIHRDIKPGNIFLTDRGQVKVLDFGLAKATRMAGAKTTVLTVGQTGDGMTLGTIAYMSPEQATGEDLDARTDLFSLGVVLYECATGRHPFPGKTSALVFSAILNKAPLAPTTLNQDLPTRLQEIIHNCLEKDRELRYQSAADLRADLKRLRRDLDSGHAHRTAEVAAAVDSAHGDDRPSAGHEMAGAAASDGRGVRSSSQPVAGAPRQGWLTIAGAVLVVALALGGYAWWADRTSQPAETTAIDDGVAALSPEAIDNRLVLARSSLAAGNYRAARASALEVLAVDPTHVQAISIRDQAEARLAEFDAAMAEARQRLASGDVQGTARALEVAREIDAAAPSIVEVSSALSELARTRTAAAREAPPPPAVARPPATTSATSNAPPSRTQPSSPAVDGQPASRPQPPPPAPSAVQLPVEPATPATSVASPATSSSPAAPAASSPSVPTAPRVVAPQVPSAPTPAERAAADEAAIRRAVATYGRAIETKDLDLFRSVKPNLSADEQRRLQAGFDAVSSQQVSLTIVSLDHQGDEARLVVSRQDVITVDGRQQTVQSQQRLVFARDGDRWVITEIQ